MESAVLLWLFSAAIGLYVLKRLFNAFYDKRVIDEMANKFVLVTGCGSGFGKEIVLRLEKLGFNVFATCRTIEGQEVIRKMCSRRVRTYCMDVTVPDQVQRVFQEVRKEIPADEGLWALVNNAGKLTVGTVEWQSLDSFRNIADVNLWGMILVTKTFLPLVKQARGRIVNMSSLSGRIVLPFMSAYCISKYGVEAFSDGLRREMQPWGVGVSIVEPGAHKTKMVNGEVLAGQWKSLWDNLGQDLQHEYGEDMLREGMKALRRFDKVCSPHIYKVVNNVCHAITSCRPQTRYVTGLDAKLLVWSTFIPTFITDFLWRAVAPAPKIKRDQR